MADSKGKKRKLNDAAQSVLYKAPREISVVKYAQNRAAEIQALAKVVKKTKESIFVNAQMPRHMRRRAMSHNVKRLPRRLREYAKDVLTTSKSKRPSRKHRRRPKNLLEEYQRRQRKHVWLETHIWHAKRFKMGDRWGYRVPLHPTNKSTRAAYRASQHSCQLIDMSYLCCIEIRGPEERIIAGFDHLTSTATGHSFGAKNYVNGCQEGEIVLYKVDKYPLDAIGPVTFMWRPVIDAETTQNRSQQVWVWSHPSTYSTVLSELLSAFKSTEGQDVHNVTTKMEVDIDNPQDTGTKTDDTADDQKSSGEKLKPQESGKHDTYKQVVRNEAYEIGNIKIESLKDRLIRHRLNGPLSQSVLASALKPANILPTGQGDDHWWNSYYDNKMAALAATQQTEFWENVSKYPSPGDVPPKCLVGLTVRDPRIIRLKQRTKVVPDPEDVMSDLNAGKESVTPDVASSAIWDPDIREKVKTTKMPEFRLNQMKSEQLIPGSEVHLGAEESRIPVLLVQQPGVLTNRKTGSKNPKSNYGSGWDVIIPSGWSMAFWVTFVYHGARAGGLRETKGLANEQLQLHFPAGYPDTEAGKEDEEEVFGELKNKHCRRPPAKRPNYVKLGIQSPFKCQWQVLVNEWMGKYTEKRNDESTNENKEGCQFYILRDTNVLEKLIQCLNGNEIQNIKSGSSESELLVIRTSDIDSVIRVHSPAIVPIQVRMVSKGYPEDFAIICIPTEDDLCKFREDKSYAGPLEVQHVDEVHLRLREEKRKLKKQKKEGSNMAAVSKVNVKSLKAESSLSVCAENVKVIKGCSRDTIGYVKHGVYMLSSGQGGGVGFCSVVGLSALVQKLSDNDQLVILLRNPKTFQYRFAYLSILEQQSWN